MGAQASAAPVLVDLRWSQGEPAGIGLYIRELAVALHHHLSVRGLFQRGAGKLPELPFEVSPLEPGAPILFDLAALRLARRTGGRLLSISRFPALFSPRHGILLQCDLTPIIVPQTHPWWRVLAERLTYWVVRRADLVLTISQTSRNDLVQRLSVDPQRICVARPGCPPVIPPRDDDLQRLRELGVEPPYVLALGTLEPRKNVGVLVEAFSRSRSRRPLRLVVAGGFGWKYRRLLSVMEPLEQAGRLIRVGYVSEGLRAILYRYAQCLAFPSLYEGFGLPILEAMSYGTPVLASTAPACVEVVGDAGILLNPHDPEDWAAAIEGLGEDQRLRDDLSQRSLERAQQFSWAQSARSLADRLQNPVVAAA